MGLKKKENSYFFCYDRKVADYLRYEKGIKYVTAARHIASNNIFYLFERTPELKEALDQR